MLHRASPCRHVFLSGRCWRLSSSLGSLLPTSPTSSGGIPCWKPLLRAYGRMPGHGATTAAIMARLSLTLTIDQWLRGQDLHAEMVHFHDNGLDDAAVSDDIFADTLLDFPDVNCPYNPCVISDDEDDKNSTDVDEDSISNSGSSSTDSASSRVASPINPVITTFATSTNQCSTPLCFKPQVLQATIQCASSHKRHKCFKPPVLQATRCFQPPTSAGCIIQCLFRWAHRHFGLVI